VCSFHKFGKAAKAGYSLLSNLYYRKAAFSKQVQKKLNPFGLASAFRKQKQVQKSEPNAALGSVWIRY
jgi:hypothetical protein